MPELLVIILPFLGFALIGLLGLSNENFRKQEKLISGLATVMVGIPFGIICYMFASFEAAYDVTLFSWMKTGGLDLSFTYHIDELSLLMGMIVTGVGMLIHIYSAGYMHGDPGYYKFFTYLNLFIFAMMNLIWGANMMVTFLGWEGVGACSYFLIGFWFTDMDKAAAAQKAFVANRIGDFAFLIAAFMIYVHTGTLTYAEMGVIGGDPAPWIAFLIFIAATGKSAQIPLYVWLPDAMAGPTPVSALIHAATMVTSGIYVIARMSATVFLQAPDIMAFVSVVGALTAILAASIAIAQNDIKKVLAYSTVSQLGYMFMALGAGAFTTAIFHVMTHAFFKACLFLGSGSVIHAMDHTHSVKDPQDVRTMGGLGKFMPHTSKTFWISTIAIAGIPPLAGFFSKDEILAKNFLLAFSGESVYWFVWIIGVITALMTAFYMTRVTYLTFNGKPRFDAEGHPPHESPANMTAPLWILAILAIVGGFLGLPEVIGHGHFNWITHSWLSPHEGVKAVTNREFPHPENLVAIEIGLIIFSIAIAAIGVFAAFNLYKKKGIEGDENVKKALGGLYGAMQNKFYVDEFYNAAIIRPFVYLSDKFVATFDKEIVDGAVNGAGWLTQGTGNVFKRLQTGLVQNYALLMAAGVVLALAYFIFDKV